MELKPLVRFNRNRNASLVALLCLVAVSTSAISRGRRAAKATQAVPSAIPQPFPTTPPDSSKINVGSPDIAGCAQVTGDSGAVPRQDNRRMGQGISPLGEKMKPKVMALFSIFMAASGVVAFILTASAYSPSAEVSGWVVDSQGRIAGATVRVRATDNFVISAPDGQFMLTGLVAGQEIEVTAWAEGYYIATTHVTPTVTGITLTLRRYHTTDHPDYEWASPSFCDGCHPALIPQWQGNAHGGAVANPRFFSLYNGTDITGTTVIAPGYQLNFPGTAGNCAACHVLGAGADGFLTTNMNDVRGVISAGIHCDYCHKIGGLYLNTVSSSVYPNAPGVLSQRILRPPEGDDIFFGPYDDIHDPDTYLPAMSESRFCAPCHQFSFWGTPVYESYNEWLNSPYVDADITCQKCHMPPNGDNYFVLPEQGGLWHPAERIPSHLDLGLKDTAFMTSTVAMTVTAEVVGAFMDVTVTLKNVAAGHHVPTDHPGRHMILTVTAQGEQGSLTLLSGPSVPAWGGAQSGSPGKIYAKLLRDVVSGEFPVVSYWKPSTIISDNRIPAMGSDTSRYRFTTPASGDQVTITAQLLFRRLFQAEADARGWNSPDILMRENRAEVVLAPWEVVYLPLIQR